MGGERRSGRSFVQTLRRTGTRDDARPRPSTHLPHRVTAHAAVSGRRVRFSRRLRGGGIAGALPSAAAFLRCRRRSAAGAAGAEAVLMWPRGIEGGWADADRGSTGRVACPLIGPGSGVRVRAIRRGCRRH